MSNEQSPTFDSARIKLEDIVIMQSRIDNPTGVSKLPSDTDIDIQFNMTPGYNEQVKKIRILFKCDLTSKTNDVKGCFEAAFFFTMDKIEDHVQITDTNKQVDIDNTLLGNLLNISYSTARGIIYTRSLGTVLDKIILPVITTATLLKPFEK